MSRPDPEFSRLVRLDRVIAQPLRTTIEATAEECQRLARRFELVTLDRLAADVVLQRVAGDRIRLDAAFEAEFAQSCVVTLDPVPGRVAETFSLLYGPPGDEQAEIEIDVEETVFEPLTGELIDIGEAVAQEVSLALPQSPRLPDALLEPAEPFQSQDGPFAALEQLRRSSRN
jgi:uncharacterized metal-binding protein YceD (DUF177 family)